jgi:hypothetical protein
MTFLEEEEVFPTFIVSDAPAIEEVNATVNDVTVNASATSGKEEEDNFTSEVVEAKQNGKRKLLDKQADKKVLPSLHVQLLLFFLIILYGHLYCVLVNLNWDCSDAEYSGYDSLSYLYTLAGS